MAYIGREPQIGNYQVCDAISVVNAQAAYTMQVSSVNVIPESVNHMIVSLNGVIQKPGSSYTISSSTITFSSNLATGDSIDFIYLLGNVLDLGTPSDDTVTGAKIVDNAINSEHYTDASIDLAHLSADSVDGSKIVDNAINSEHYTDGSIDTAHIADAQITTAKLATTVLTGATDIGAAIVDADLLLVDDGAGGTLRKTAASRLKTYIGAGTNTPAFEAYLSGDQNIGDGNLTKITFQTEVYDDGGGYDNSSAYRFTVPSGEGGTYRFYTTLNFDDNQNAQKIGFRQLFFYKNGASYAFFYNDQGTAKAVSSNFGSGQITLVLNATDYVEVYAMIGQTDDNDATITGYSNGKRYSVFGGYKIIR